MYSILATDQFLRQARKFFKKHPDLKARFGDLVKAMSEDPFQSSLSLHPLTGKLEGLWAVTIPIVSAMRNLQVLSFLSIQNVPE